MDPSGTHPGDAVVACAPPERYGLVMAGAPSLLVETWVSGWARARGTPPPERHRDGFRVEVGAPDQRTRYVFPAVSATLTRLAEDIRLPGIRSEEHTSELQSLIRISYAVFCLK